MITSRETETLINKRRKCESCGAAEGKKHPHDFLVVHLQKRIINGRMVSLCQRCKNKVNGRFHDKESKTNFFPH